MTLRPSSPRIKRRWTLLVGVVGVLTLVGGFTALAALDRTLFELDKDATNNTTYTKIAVLNAAVASSTSLTSIQVCQDVSAFYNGAKVLIDGERMTLAGGSNAAGGGCPSGFTFKRNYNATRGVDSTTPGAHSKAENVSRITTGNDVDFPGPDWNQVYDNIQANPSSKCNSAALVDLGAVECAFTSDGRAMSVFTQAKDYDEISDTSGVWKWRDQSVPDANELDDGFAIKYVKGDGSQHLFFGADRYATNGTKDAGFWFFHKDVAALPPVGSADGLFSGTHTAPTPGTNGVFCKLGEGGNVMNGQASPLPACQYDNDDTAGDVLILTTFTGGDTVPTVRVFEWIGPSGSVAALLERGVQGDCVPGAGTQELCATVNDTTIEVAWPYSGKGEAATKQIPNGGFLEGGVDLTALGLEGCFSSFMATSRSSAELTADLKDFILGSFEACGSTLVTTPKRADGTTNVGTDLSIGTGSVQVTDSAQLTVTGTTTWSGTLQFYLCKVATVADTDTCTSGGTAIGSAINVNQSTTQPIVSAAATVTAAANGTTGAPGRYCWRAEFTSATLGVPNATDDSSGECFIINPVTPTLSTQVIDVNGDNLTTAVPFGQAIYDKATLSGAANKPGTPIVNPTTAGAAAGGTITFRLYGPSTTATPTTTQCNTLAAGFATAYPNGIQKTVTGNGSYTTLGSGFTPQAPGYYFWKAEYSGDDPNTLGQTHNGDCSATAERVQVLQLNPAISTAQSFVPNDSATITVASGGGDLAGSVVFKLYVNSTDCSGTPAYTSSSIDITTGTGSGLSRTVVSSNTTAYNVNGTAFKWVVEYTSTNSAHTNVTSPCGKEISSITIDNNVSLP